METRETVVTYKVTQKDVGSGTDGVVLEPAVAESVLPGAGDSVIDAKVVGAEDPGAAEIAAVANQAGSVFKESITDRSGTG